MSAMGNAHRGKQNKILALEGRNYFAKLMPLFPKGEGDAHINNRRQEFAELFSQNTTALQFAPLQLPYKDRNKRREPLSDHYAIRVQ